MKKSLALLMAALLALAGLPAGAEDAWQNEPVTLNIEWTMDAEAARLLAAGLYPEASEPETFQGLLALLNGFGLRFTADAEAVRGEIALADSALLSFSCLADAEGPLLVSTLFPAYAVRLPAEDAPGGTPEALLAAAGYVERAMEETAAALTPGAAEKGSFEAEGEVFGERSSVSVDAPALAAAVTRLAEALKADAALQGQSLVSYSGLTGMDFSGADLPRISAERFGSGSVELYRASLMPSAAEVTLRRGDGAARITLKVPGIGADAVLDMNFDPEEDALPDIAAGDLRLYAEASLETGSRITLKASVYLSGDGTPLPGSDFGLSLNAEGKQTVTWEELTREGSPVALALMGNILVSGLGSLLNADGKKTGRKP